ncbi:MAG: hypothetical protein NTW49_05140 [Bacteroidia bacterium]|nr:hypothetical protein [Bacteroidia bacterium]
MRNILIVICTCLVLTLNSKAQTSKADSLKRDSMLSNALKVFMDIGTCYYCDFSYIRKEIDYVNYVRDPKESQVQVIITENTTGSGGNEFLFMFIGKKEFEGMNDTIKQATSVNNTQDENRAEIVRILKMGLMRFVMKTPGNKLIEIKSNLPESGNEKVQDKWKSWVYNINVSGYGNGDQNYTQLQVSTYASARQVTPDRKINFSVNSSYSKAKYVYNDTTDIRTYHRTNRFDHSYIKSLGKHWSAGYFYYLYTSTFSNIKSDNGLSAGVEYDVFPYDISSSKLITFRYKIGFDFNQYIDTTIYNKLKETLLSHSLGMGKKIKKKWGSANTSVVYSNYLHDFRKNNLYFSANINVRIFNGLSVNGYLYVSGIHDQLALQKGSATYEEVLLQQHQLATQYSYYISLGITYTFGSIYNNVVNPRFDY